MIKRNITLFTAIAAAAAFAPSAQAAISLPDPGTVGPYRVIFVTSTNPAADATVTMPELNAWVTGLAVTSGLDTAATSPGWNVVGATTSVDVFTNTGLALTGGVPIYLADGTAFATDNADLWGLGATVLNVNENGDSGTWGAGSWVHTGLAAGPITAVGSELDAANISHGGLDAGYNPWYGTGDNWAGGIDNGSLFAVSGVISPVPEPASMSLLVLGGMGLLLRRRRN